MSFPLTGQVALVTGAGTGIGLMIATVFAKNGAKVYITGRRLAVLEAAVSSGMGLSGSLVALQLDVTNEESVKKAAEIVKAQDGKLDILVNNAGINGPVVDQAGFMSRKMAAEDPLEPESFKDWVDMFTINSIAPFFVIRAFTDLLLAGARSRGADATSSVINISSAATYIRSNVTINALGYCPSKAALHKITVVLATHFASRRLPIRINQISPGVFPSQLSAELLDDLNTKPLPGFVAPVPSRRAGTEEEMGSTALYLATAGYTNGIDIKIDGGVSLVNP
ncbi:NAD(P)-binding protein [Hymenopellis radicata]|nr:NAD(P)-binding protein [Hymenopellis radicata]